MTTSGDAKRLARFLIYRLSLRNWLISIGVVYNSSTEITPFVALINPINCSPVVFLFKRIEKMAQALCFSLLLERVISIFKTF